MLTVRREGFRFLPLFALLTALGASGAPVALRQKSPEPAPRYNGTFRIKGFLTPFNQVFDPAAPSHYFICEQLYDGLVKFDAHFNPMPSLAAYWTVSDEGKAHHLLSPAGRPFS